MKIGLFIPCYVNALYPEVGVATHKLLKSLALDVDYPLNQTCCGQPMANAGFEKMADNIASRFDQLFDAYDYVVAPSASCAAFVKLYHPRNPKASLLTIRAIHALSIPSPRYSYEPIDWNIFTNESCRISDTSSLSGTYLSAMAMANPEYWS